jgi:hypothetical protein
MLKNPAHSESCHADAGWNYPPDLFNRIQGNIEVYTGKGFSPIKSLPIAIKTPMVIGRELSVPSYFAAE